MTNSIPAMIRPLLLSLLFAACGQPLAASGRIVFPEDPSALEVKRDLGAKGDGLAHDTRSEAPAPSPANPSAARPPLPRLKVSDNHRFLVTADSQPFFWLGDTAWELFHRLDQVEAELYLRDRAAKGFNVIQAVALAELDGLAQPNRYGHLPLLKRDPARPAVKPGPDNDYWDFVDTVVDMAAAKGLYLGFLPTWGKYVTSSPFDGKVDGIFNVTNALAYGQFLGTRYRDYSNLIWILGGDKAPSTPEAVAIWRAMARGITLGVAGRENYGAVLMTYHTSGPGHVSDHIHGEPWLDFTSAQSSHGDLVESWRFIGKHWNRQPIKPVIDLESSYPDALIGAAGLPLSMRAAHLSTKPSNDDHARRAAYWAVFAGAFGHTYGHNSIWQMYEPPRKPILNARLTWREALNAPSARQMGYLRVLMESRPMLDRVPDQTLIAGDAGAGAEHIRAARGDGYALFYAPIGKPFRVRLDKLTGKQVKAWWFDPRTGQTTVAGQFAREGEREFTPPGEPRVGNDWVLLLDDPERGFGAPRVALKPFDPPGLGLDPVVNPIDGQPRGANAIATEPQAAVATYEQRIATVTNTPGCVAFWNFVKREPEGAHRFTAYVPLGATNDYPLDAANYIRDFWREGREATYADFPLLGRGPFGQAIRIRAEKDKTFRPFLFVPRERLHDSPLDIKGAGKSVSLVVWAIREGGNHALAGIWHEGTDLNHGGAAKVVARGQRQYALFAGLNKEGSACGHVSENGTSSFLNKYALHKCNSASQSPAVPADSPADVLDKSWQCFAMTFDHERREITGWLNGIAGARWLENPKHDKLISSAYQAYMQGYFAKLPGLQEGEDETFPKDQYYTPPEGEPVSVKVIRASADERVELREHRYTKVEVVLKSGADGKFTETSRDLVALRLNPWWYPHGIYSPKEAQTGGPFTIGRVIHSSRSVGFTGWIGGVAVFNRALTSEEIKRLYAMIPGASQTPVHRN